MNGKKYFREACQQMGIDCDNNFVVVSQNHIQGNGYVCRYSHLNRKPSQLYIVNYIKERDIYIAWNLKERLGDKKDVFRVLTVGLNDLTQEAIKTIKKPIEYKGKDEETVYAFLGINYDLFYTTI